MTGPSSRFRLFCLPYAGGSARIYRPWRAALPEGMELCPIELPGHGERIGEPPIATLDGLVSAVTDAVLARTGPPYALFGHSLGALLAFESARVLQACGVGPEALFVSGHRAPQVASREAPIYHLGDAEFIASVGALGGTVPAVLADDQLMQLLLPAMRADFTVSDTYRLSPGAPLRCPVEVFGGLDDTGVRLSDLDAWSRCTIGPCRVSMFAGDHFFVHTQGPVLVKEIQQILGM
jgi:medium-chain acyl-[acyl-carrier-protein] hydrolase